MAGTLGPQLGRQGPLGNSTVTTDAGPRVRAPSCLTEEWAPLSTSWKPVQPGVHRPSPEGTGGNPLQETTGGCAMQNKDMGPGAGVPCQRGEWNPGDGRKQSRCRGGVARAKGEKAPKVLPGGHAGRPARSVQEGRQPTRTGGPDPRPLQEGLVDGGGGGRRTAGQRPVSGRVRPALPSGHGGRAPGCPVPSQ